MIAQSIAHILLSKPGVLSLLCTATLMSLDLESCRFISSATLHSYFYLFLHRVPSVPRTVESLHQERLP